MFGIQVDFVGPAVNTEVDGLVGWSAGQVILKLDVDALHGFPLESRLSFQPAQRSHRAGGLAYSPFASLRKPVDVTSPSPQAEIMIRGTVRAEADDDLPPRAAAVQARLGWQPVPGAFALFAIDIIDVACIGHDPATNPSIWPAGQLGKATCVLR